MLNFTTNQWAVVALLFVAGWLLGLMSRSTGGGRWRRDYEREHEAHLALRRDYDALVAKRAAVATGSAPDRVIGTVTGPAPVATSADHHF